MWPRNARSAIATLGLGALGLGGCSASAQPGPSLTCSEARAWQQTGTASWYGAGHDGLQTASGETFDMDGLTAAHRRLPFGTRVRVTNLRNGRAATFTINDRGPFVDGRVIDVSRRGAGLLGFRRAGVTPVRLEVVGGC